MEPGLPERPCARYLRRDRYRRIVAGCRVGGEDIPTTRLIFVIIHRLPWLLGAEDRQHDVSVKVIALRVFPIELARENILNRLAGTSAKRHATLVTEAEQPAVHRNRALVRAPRA